MDHITIVVIASVVTFVVIGYFIVRSMFNDLVLRINDALARIDGMSQRIEDCNQRFKAYRDYSDHKNANQDSHVHDQFYRLRHLFKICDALNEEWDLNNSIDYYKSMAADLEAVKKTKGRKR